MNPFWWIFVQKGWNLHRILVACGIIFVYFLNWSRCTSLKKKTKDFQIRSRVNYYIAELSTHYCWWLKSCTTWDVWNPIDNGINYQDFSHQQYHRMDVWYVCQVQAFQGSEVDLNTGNLSSSQLKGLWERVWWISTNMVCCLSLMMGDLEIFLWWTNLTFSTEIWNSLGWCGAT